MNEPDFEHMTPAEIDEMLLGFGMDPVKIREHGKVFMGVLLEKMVLKSKLEKVQAELEFLETQTQTLKAALHPLLEWLGYIWACHGTIGNLNMGLIPKVMKAMGVPRTQEDAVRYRYYERCFDYFENYFTDHRPFNPKKES